MNMKVQVIQLKKLFGKKDISASCSYCVHGRLAPNKESVLCKKSGLVDLDYSCRKFKYDPLKRQPVRPRPIIKYEEEDFSLTVDDEVDFPIFLEETE